MMTSDSVDPAVTLKMATDIVIAFLGNGSIAPDQLATLVREVRAALADEARAVDQPQTGPPPPISSNKAASRPPQMTAKESIAADYLISFEDGKPYRSLRRHLMAKHGLTPDQYRAKWGLPADYPMVAPSYAAQRSEVAKRIGLGHSKAKVEPLRRKGPARRRAPTGDDPPLGNSGTGQG
jgi:predicted transcriptional regulator